jgi:hypothetical protein
MKISKEYIKEVQQKEFEDFQKTKYYKPFVIGIYVFIILIGLLCGIGLYELIKYLCQI